MKKRVLKISEFERHIQQFKEANPCRTVGYGGIEGLIPDDTVDLIEA